MMKTGHFPIQFVARSALPQLFGHLFDLLLPRLAASARWRPPMSRSSGHASLMQIKVTGWSAGNIPGQGSIFSTADGAPS
jgi:hypothetical protein